MTTQSVTGLRHHKARPARPARVVGYLIAAAINVAFIWGVNVAPGWQSLPLLSEDFVHVVGLMTLSFALGVMVNLVFVAFDRRWVKRLGDALTGAAGFAVLLRLVQIFPFDLGSRWAGWETLLRILLGLACIGTGIGVIANLVLFRRRERLCTTW